MSHHGITEDLLGRGMQDLRISLTDRCNFRCQYCMPAEVFGEHYEFLPKPDLLTFEEITRLCSIFAPMGIRKIRLTGGEPLLRKNAHALVGMIRRSTPIEDVTLTTNGAMLRRYAMDLKNQGLSRISISLDSLNNDVFREMNGRGVGLADVLDGIEAASAAGFHPIKINCVVIRGKNDQGILDMVEHFRHTGHILRFIEFMDVGTRNNWEMESVISSDELISKISMQYPLEPLPQNYVGEVAGRYAYKDGAGEIGFISSVTQPFCGNCTRARLTPDGRLVTCLFAASGISLRDPMRAGASDEDIFELICDVWSRRTDRYSEERSAQTNLNEWSAARSKIEMYQLGG